MAPSATPSPLAPGATATPNISIVPVPTSQLAAPVAYAAHLDAATAKALQTALSGIRSSGKYPGVSAAVVFPDGTMWKGIAGQAILSPAAALTPDTLMSIGSISKTFVAALVGRLVQDGTMGLDDPLSKYVPDFTNAAKISIRQLLDHTSGIRDLFKVKSIVSAFTTNPGATWTADKVLAQIGPQLYAPGSHYYYSNTDYVLLGKAVEKATGKSLATLIRSDFLTPLGMTHTYLQTQEKATGPEAYGYMKKGSSVSNHAGTMLPSPPKPARPAPPAPSSQRRRTWQSGPTPYMAATCSTRPSWRPWWTSHRRWPSRSSHAFRTDSASRRRRWPDRSPGAIAAI